MNVNGAEYVPVVDCCDFWVSMEHWQLTAYLSNC